MADSFDLPKIEEKILKFWKDRKIFERTLENRKYGRRFVFFEGPPYANGRPGIHHFLGRSIKDLFLRYKTMRGYLVARKAGWDTHGLPIEIEAEKKLGIKSKKEIEKIGIDVFNQKAKESIWDYKEEWERFTHRIGFWLDLKNPYVTYEPKYIETLWWVISQMAKRKLLYKGHKVLPWCPRCGTALASHEVAQGYEDITETSVYVKFKLKAGQKIGKTIVDDKTYILAWTTTPWTLPGNVALAVGKSIKYSVLSIEGGEEQYILANDLAEKTFNTKYEILNTISGKDLVGLEYEPLFDIPHLQTKTAYKIYPADFVTTGDGTGIVHTAVMYGEDDYELGNKIGLPKHHTVDEQGRFTDEVTEFAGQSVREASGGIIEYLQNKSLLFKTQEYTHSYPFCWRCKSPLIYYARDSWFVAMSKLRKQLVKNNNKTNWVPPHLKSGRFGEFIKEAKDWAISRERYWGTPLPFWHCQKCKNQLVAGSFDDLETNRYRPKNTFYILRHGIREGAYDQFSRELTSSRLEFDKYDLTPEGVEQINEAASSLDRGGGIDLVFSSPFLRARNTAKIVADKFNHRVIIDERLKELDHGSVCEGKTHNVCLLPGINPDFSTRYGDGESWGDVRKRMFSLVAELDNKYEGKKILLVGHGDPLWIIQGVADGATEKEMLASREKTYISRGELRKVDFKNYPYNEMGELDPHRPYVDAIHLKCSKCGDIMKRIKEVADVWFDSGAMPYAQWHYPFENSKTFKNNFPADFIAEGIDQTRGWFYTLLAVATALGKSAPYKNVISYGHVLDAKGKKMSKSVGNVVNPWEVFDKFGVDAARWYFYTVNDPADSKLFATVDVGKKLNSFAMTLGNSIRFFELYAEVGKRKPKAEAMGLLDEWVLSRLNSLKMEATRGLDRYDYNKPARAIERFVVEDLSNWWIRRSREKFQKPKDKQELVRSAQLLRFILVELSKIMAPFAPFLADHIYKKLDNRKESVHLEDWSRVKKRLIKPELEKQMSDLRSLIADGLAQRKAAGIKVRQPLASAILNSEKKFEVGLEELILAELNVKKISYDSNQKELMVLDKNLTTELVREGYAREIVRQLQDMRKEVGYKIDEKVWGAWDSENPEIIEVLARHGKEIGSDVLLKEFSRGHDPKEKFDIEKEFEVGPQAKIWLGVRK